MLALIGLLACAHMPPAPEDLSTRDWDGSVDRSALPAASLHVYTLFRGRMPYGMAFQEGRGDWPEVAGYAYVLEHPTEGLVVIDPGYGRRAISKLHEFPGRLLVRSGALEVEEALADILARERPGEAVGHVLLTHMHVDHAGGLEDFPGVTVHIDPVEWDFGMKRRLLRATVPPLEDPERVVEALAFDDGPWGPFERSEDVFGDGVLIALSTPGHTPGHTSFLVNLPDRSVLIVGDVAWYNRHWEGPELKGGFSRRREEVDWRANVDALWRVHELQARYPELIVLSGHDPANARVVESRI